VPVRLANGCFQVALPGCDDAEGDAGFSLPHGCPHGAVEAGAGRDDFGGERFGHAVLGEVPVAVPSTISSRQPPSGGIKQTARRGRNTPPRPPCLEETTISQIPPNTAAAPIQSVG
jgi:hypothetical protein